MKKIMISILLVLGTFSMASAEVGVKIGVSGMVGVFEADGFEKEGTETNKSKNGEEILLGMGSVFVEKNFRLYTIRILFKSKYWFWPCASWNEIWCTK